MHLIGKGEVVPRLGRRFTDRFHRAAHTGEGITDRNQLATLTLHGFTFPQNPDSPEAKLTEGVSIDYSSLRCHRLGASRSPVDDRAFIV